ncbi:MAG TPA: ClbS/DfsB family four-helix bundle protein [Patescibacteria group bacterium]|jgi:hypothetical protein|nr:ClbS/DfsB family four-helix bundle protein [Patescibacteria group bacterium]
MSDKTTLLREADEAFAELRQAFDGLGEAPMRQVWLGTWGVREILIHISGWHRAMIPALGHVAKGEPPYPTGTYDDFDTWNARFVEQQSGVKVGDIVSELDASHRAFVAAASALPEPLFDNGGAGRDLLDGAGTGHYREHTAQIRDWRRTSGN